MSSIVALPFVLVCRECGGGDEATPLAFESQEARGKWASAHTRETGHDLWFCPDRASLERDREKVTGLMFLAFGLEHQAGRMAEGLRADALLARLDGSEPEVKPAVRDRWLAVLAEMGELLKLIGRPAG